MDFSLDLPVQGVGRETKAEIYLGFIAGGLTERGEKGMAHYCQHCWLVTKWFLVSRIRNLVQFFFLPGSKC